MIKTIIFDFGDVFINLDKSATLQSFSQLGINSITKELVSINESYEIGVIDTLEFINYYKKLLPKASDQQIIDGWNAILKDFPKQRLEFIQKLANSHMYQLILLSNTNELHINWIKENVSFYSDFKSCFDSFYLSHEIHLRKPNQDIFQFVIENHQLNPSEILFIDDTSANTNAAEKLGIHTWNNNPMTEDITDLFTIKANLF
ncbi:HAD family hydrolase [Aquimarina sp. SS2-1]|uniref:HAD family hydrolase n=1 Tax=Aquimarina besae TaxID=3342247 RepID=UPI003671E946